MGEVCLDDDKIGPDWTAGTTTWLKACLTV